MCPFWLNNDMDTKLQMMLGYSDHASIKLEDQSIESPVAAMQFLESLGAEFKEPAKSELNELRRMKSEKEGTGFDQQ